MPERLRARDRTAQERPKKNFSSGSSSSSRRNGLTFARAAVVLGDDRVVLERPVRRRRGSPRARGPPRRSRLRAATRSRGAGGSPAGRPPTRRPPGARSRSRHARDCRRRRDLPRSVRRSARLSREPSRLDYTIASPVGIVDAIRGSVLVPVVALTGRGADRAVRDPRAPPRPPARGGPAGSLRHEPLHARADPAAARPARHRARARRRPRRPTWCTRSATTSSPMRKHTSSRS